MKKILLTILTTSLLTGLNCYAGGDDESPNIGYKHYTTITANFKTGTFDPYSVPFDVPFIIRGPIDEEILSVEVRYIEHNENYSQARLAKDITDCNKLCSEKSVKDPKSCSTNCKKYWNNSKTVRWVKTSFTNSEQPEKDTFYVIIPPLDPIKKYDFTFRFTRRVSDDENLQLNENIKPKLKDFANQFYIQDVNVAGVYVEGIGIRLTNINNQRVKELADNIIDEVIRYYSTKHIEFEEEIISKKIKPAIGKYLLDKFWILMPERHKAQKNLEAILSNQSFRDARSEVNSSYMIRTINTKQNKLQLTAKQKSTINTLATFTVLKAVTEGKTRISDEDVYTDDQQITPASQIQNYLQRVRSFNNDVKELIIYLTNNRSTVQKVTNQYRTYTKDIQKLETLTKYLDIIEAHMSEHQSATELLENTIANPEYNFKLDLPIPMVGLEGQTTATFVTRGEWYITADIGIAYTYFRENTGIVPYLGANFNFFPINRQANYSLIKILLSPEKDIIDILKSMSGVIGVTLGPINDFNNNYSDSWEANQLSVVTGLGLRVTDGVRLSGGSVWGYRNKNGLSTVKSLQANPYVALSLDWDLRRLIGNITKKLQITD